MLDCLKMECMYGSCWRQDSSLIILFSFKGLEGEKSEFSNPISRHLVFIILIVLMYPFLEEDHLFSVSSSPVGPEL